MCGAATGGDMKDRIILDLCGGTGSWSKPYRDAGYDVRVITLPDNDVRTYIPPDNVHGVLAAPPCDEFSIAKDHKIERNIGIGIEIVDACLEIVRSCKPVFNALENPIGLLQKYLGWPSYVFQPWNFGDPWTKKTGIWGTFNAPRKIYHKWEDVPKNSNLYIRPGRTKPSIAFLHKSAKQFIDSFSDFECETDAGFRAITPQGFANAFFKENP